MKLLNPQLYLIIFLLYCYTMFVLDEIIKINGKCLTQNKVTFTQEKVVIIYIAYEMNLLACKKGSNFTLTNSLFGTVTLTKSADFGKYKYSRYGIGFDARGIFFLSDNSSFGKNVITSGANMSVSVNLLQVLEDTALTEKKQYAINCSQPQKNVCIIIG